MTKLVLLYHGSEAPRTAAVQHAHSRGSHAFTHSHQHSYNHMAMRSASSAITEFGIHFFFMTLHEGGGANRDHEEPSTTRRKTPLFGVTYTLFEEKIQGPGRVLNPRPPTLVISSPWPGQELAPRLTHCCCV